jgi:hypothetical protein
MSEAKDIDLGKLQNTFARDKRTFELAKKNLAKAQRAFDDTLRIHMASKTALEGAAKVLLNKQSL